MRLKFLRVIKRTVLYVFTRATANPAAVCVIFACLAIAPFCVSCSETEPPAIIVEETENTHEALFNILSSENNHSSDISVQHIRDFYADGMPIDQLLDLTKSQTLVDATLTASVDSVVFGDDAMYADFTSKFLRDASLSIKSKRDPALNESITNIAVSLSGQKLAGADLLIDGGKRFCLRSEELYPDYIAIEYADLMDIISEATQNATVKNLSFDNPLSLYEKYSDFFELADIGRDQLKDISKPFIEKLKDVIADENITIEYDASVEGIPGDGFKKVSVSLANEDLRQILTTLAQAAKENTALLDLIKTKYSIIYENILELKELGVSFDTHLNDLPPVESIESMLKSSFAAFEVMLGSSTGLPFKAMAFDFYLDDGILKYIQINIWKELPNTAEPNTTGGGKQNAAAAAQIVEDSVAAEEAAPPNSVSIIQNAGKPVISINIKSYVDSDQWRRDSLSADFEDADGNPNRFLLESKLLAGVDGGSSKIDFMLAGPWFNNDIPNISIAFDRESESKSLLINTRLRNASGEEEPASRLWGKLSEGEDGGLDFEIEIGLNDPGAQKKPLDDKNPYAVNIQCVGNIQTGPVDIPSIEDEELFVLVRDSFYDGTFETVFNEFFTNLIIFASANRQLLSLYGFPGFS